MKTKILHKQEKNINFDKNFLNNQNYIRDKKFKLYFNYVKKYSLIEHLLFYVFWFFIIWWVTLLSMFIFSFFNNIKFFLFFIIFIFLLLLWSYLTIKIMQYIKYLLNYKGKTILYLKPYSLLKSSSQNLNHVDFYIKYFRK